MKTRIRKQDLQGAKVYYFIGTELLSSRFDDFETLHEAIYYEDAATNVEFVNQNTGVVAHYQRKGSKFIRQ